MCSQCLKIPICQAFRILWKLDPYLRVVPITTGRNYLMYQAKMLSCHCDKALTKRDWRVRSISCSPEDPSSVPTSGGSHACNSSSRGSLNICTHNHLHIIKIYLKQKSTNQKQSGEQRVYWAYFHFQIAVHWWGTSKQQPGGRNRSSSHGGV